MRKTNDAVAKWLDRRCKDRAKLMQLSIFSYLIPAENSSELVSNGFSRDQDHGTSILVISDLGTMVNHLYLFEHRVDFGSRRGI